MARSENTDLIVSLSLKDNLSAPMASAKQSLDRTEASAERLGNSVEAAGGKLRTFRRIGSEIGQVGRSLGGEFEDATNAADNFIVTAGSAGLAIKGIAEVAPVAATAVGALGASLAVVAAPLAVVAVGVGAFVIAAQRTVTPLERAQTALQVTQTRVDLLDRALKNGQITPEAYAQRLALIRPAATGAAAGVDQLTHAIGPLDLIASAVQKSLQLMNAEIDKSGIGLVTVTGTQKAAADAAETHRLRLVGETDQLEATSRAANDLAASLFNIPREIDINVVFRRSIALNAGLPPGSADTIAGNAFTPGGNADALAAAQNAFNTQQQLDAQRKAEADRLAAERAAKAAEATRLAKQRAEELARVYRDQVAKAFDKARETANSLFDALHDRVNKAISDAENLAQKNHDAAIQAIADNLKAEQAAHAGPADAAQRALDQRQAEQQRRNLVEAQQAAAQAAAANRDPSQAASLALQLRAATEALQNFDAQAAIDRLKAVQVGLDAISQQHADDATKAADKALDDAKAEAQKDRDAETLANAKRKRDFEAQLAALEARDLKAKKSPKEIQADIDALSRRFGITTDALGFHHIEDPIVTAIKEVKIDPPQVTVINNQRFLLQVGAQELRLIASALTTGNQPAATSSVRTGAGGRN